jgi:hypothetical protein
MYDYYPTPPWCTQLLLEHYPPPTKYIVEPSAGDGAIVREIKRWKDVAVCGIEIQERFEEPLRKCCDFVHMGDFFHHAKHAGNPINTSYIGNPPYSLALQFIKEAMRLGVRYIAMLLRMDFLGSKERARFHNEHPLTQLRVLGKRPAFKGTGATDVYNYAWFIWDKIWDDQHRELIPAPYKPPLVVLP